MRMVHYGADACVRACMHRENVMRCKRTSVCFSFFFLGGSADFRSRNKGSAVAVVDASVMAIEFFSLFFPIYFLPL